MAELDKKNKKAIFIYVILLYLFSWTSIKLSLPALPLLSKLFVDGSFYTKLSIGVFFYTFAISMPFWGSLSEYVGRRKSLLIAFILAGVGSLIVSLAVNGPMFIIGRGIEGLAMGVVSPVGRAIVADLYKGDTFAKQMSIVGMIVWTVPAFAPVIGGGLLLVFSWRIIFILALVFAIIFYFYTKARLVETHQPKENAIKPVKAYLELFSSRLFWCYAISYGLLTGGVLSYYAAMPFWFVNQWHLSVHLYGFLGIYTMAGYILGLVLSNVLMHLHKSGKWVLKVLDEDGLIFIAMAIAIVFILMSFGFGLKISNSVGFIVTVMSVFAFCAGLAMPSINAGIMNKFHHLAGPASAAITLVVYLVAGLSTAITTNLDVHNLLPVLLFAGISTVVSTLLIKLAP